MAQAREILPGERLYRGRITEPDRWDAFRPREGDVILATPAKSGTTWTQSMIAMLLNGTDALPDKLSRMSPWIDSNFSALDDDLVALERQPGRRVIKTHTPVDGWPVWEGVPVVLVFRHPMEVFLSIRKHLKNARAVEEHPLIEPLETSLPHFLESPCDADDIDADCLASIVHFFETAVLSDRLPWKLVMNYAGISRAHEATVRALDAFLGTDAPDELIHAVTRATEFTSMKARASDFAPEAVNGVWRDDSSFFAGGRSGSWEAEFTEAQVAAYQARFAELLPNPAHRRWIETGFGNV